MHETAGKKPRGRAGNPITPWFPALMWMLFVYTLSAQTVLPSPSRFGITDKMAHFIVFGVLGLALAYGRYRSPRRPPHWVPIGVGILYGVLDEMHQAFVPRRTPELLDFVADVAGVLVGYAFVALLLAVLGRAVAGAAQRRHARG